MPPASRRAGSGAALTAPFISAGGAAVSAFPAPSAGRFATSPVPAVAVVDHCGQGMVPPVLHKHRRVTVADRRERVPRCPGPLLRAARQTGTGMGHWLYG